MKKMKLKLLLAVFSAVLIAFSSCKKDEDEGTPSNIPTLGRDFTVTVVDNDVTFTTTFTGNTWFTNTTTGTEYQAVAGEITITISLAGTYPFVCSNINATDGPTYVSDTFNVVIAQTDLSFLEQGFWKNLTGGPQGGKTWRLDNFMSPGGNQYNKYFSSALKYYQYTGEGDASSWNNGGHNLYKGDWTTNFSEYTTATPGPEIGTISFDGATMTATLEMDSGINVSTGLVESFNSTSKVDITVQSDPFGYKTDLETLYGIKFSDEWATVSFTAPTRFPLDKGRVAVGEFTTTGDGTLYNVKIISCTDSALIVSVERVYEVDGAESSCRLLYNFICDDYTYTYDDPDVFIPPDRPATSGTLEDGTYSVADIPVNYYNWDPAGFADTWESIDAYKLNMGQWWCLGQPSETVNETNDALTAVGEERWAASYAAYTAQTVVVSGSDVTVNYKGINVWGDDPTALIESSVSTTFTASGGVITFADSVSIYAPNGSFDKVVEMYILPGTFDTGIGMGVDNINADNKTYQSKLVNLIKQ